MTAVTGEAAAAGVVVDIVFRSVFLAVGYTSGYVREGEIYNQAIGDIQNIYVINKYQNGWK